MAVQQITDQEFSDTLKANNKVIIKYYADWCGSCRLITPKFKKFSEDERFKDITFLDIDAEKNPEARKWAKVTNLPFFAIVKNGELVEADNFAKEERILDMLQKLSA